ncbi:MAG: type 4a pilus biogenesis protein PilO [bacterium]
MEKKKLDLKIKLTPDKILVALAVIFVLSLAGAGVFLVPKIMKARDDLKEETAKTIILKNKAGILDQLATNSTLLKQDQAVLTNALPQLIDTPDFMGRVSQVATDSAVKVESFQLVSKGGPEAENLSRSSATTNFSLSASGSYANIVTFIKNLENFAGIVGFNTLEVSQSQAEDGLNAPSSDALEANFSLWAYYLPQKEDSMPVDRNIDFSANNEDYRQWLESAKQMVYWQSEEYHDPVGKVNPFVR